jgi:hypothetical protein
MQAKQAVELAKDYLSDLYAPEQISKLALEEVEFDDSSSDWLVTLSFHRPLDPDSPGLSRALGRQRPDYKIVRISDTDGRVTSVKIRELTAQ